MGFASAIQRLFGYQAPQPRRTAPTKERARSNPRPMATYDAAQTTPENKNHWGNADGLGPNASLSPDVRAKIRYRARYERDNNGYAGSLVEGRANDTIGTGPRLQLTLPENWSDPDFQVPQTVPEGAERMVELLFLEWSEKISLPDDLLLIDETETTDGEVFAVAFSNPVLSPSGDSPTLDIALYEADQCRNPVAMPWDPMMVDGKRFDQWGNPIEYYFLKQHPGEMWWVTTWEFDTIPADRVFHFYKRRRPKAARGVSGLTPALPLYSIMRRFTLAGLSSAEAQAMIAAVLKNNNMTPPGDGQDAPEIEAMDQIAFAKAMLLTLHAGQDVTTLDPSQPAPNYKEFKGEVLAECGRAIGAPRNIATGSSADYNYSSGRLDILPHIRSIKIRREKFRRLMLDRLFRMWIAEAALIRGFLPEGLPPLNLWKWRWRWDSFDSIDALKDALAAKNRILAGITTLEREASELGEDWEEVLDQQSREAIKRKTLGLPDPVMSMKPTGAPAPGENPNAPDGAPAEEIPADA